MAAEERTRSDLAPDSDLAFSPKSLLDEIPLLISGGGDTLPLRRVAENVLYRLNQFLRYERRARYVFTQWDYTVDPGRDEAIGHVPDRSLEAVENSEGVIAIVGDTVPKITQLEIRRVYELRSLGQHRELWFFVSREAKTAATHERVPLHQFLDAISSDFHVERIYHAVDDQMDFQASLLIEMMPFVVARAGTAFGPLDTTR